MSKVFQVLYVRDELDICAVTEFTLEDEGFVLTSSAILERGSD